MSFTNMLNRQNLRKALIYVLSIPFAIILALGESMQFTTDRLIDGFYFNTIHAHEGAAKQSAEANEIQSAEDNEITLLEEIADLFLIRPDVLYSIRRLLPKDKFLQIMRLMRELNDIYKVQEDTNRAFIKSQNISREYIMRQINQTDSCEKQDTDLATQKMIQCHVESEKRLDEIYRKNYLKFQQFKEEISLKLLNDIKTKFLIVQNSLNNTLNSVHSETANTINHGESIAYDVAYLQQQIEEEQYENLKNKLSTSIISLPHLPKESEELTPPNEITRLIDEHDDYNNKEIDKIPLLA